MDNRGSGCNGLSGLSLKNTPVSLPVLPSVATSHWPGSADELRRLRPPSPGSKRLRIGLERLVRRLEQDVPIHSYSESVSDGHVNRRLDIEITSSDHRARLADLVAHGSSRCIRRTRVHKRTAAIPAALAQIECRRQNARESRKTEQALIVPIYFMRSPAFPCASRPTIPLIPTDEPSG